MERRKKAEPKDVPVTVEQQVRPEEEVEFIKVGRGSLRFPRRVFLGSQKSGKGAIIKPNQHFWARPSEVPKAFADTVRPVVDLPPEPPLDVIKPGYKMQQNAKDPTLYDVVDMQGKIMNEQPLSGVDAGELLKALG